MGLLPCSTFSLNYWFFLLLGIEKLNHHRPSLSTARPKLTSQPCCFNVKSKHKNHWSMTANQILAFSHVTNQWCIYDSIWARGLIDMKEGTALHERKEGRKFMKLIHPLLCHPVPIHLLWKERRHLNSRKGPLQRTLSQIQLPSFFSKKVNGNCVA